MNTFAPDLVIAYGNLSRGDDAAGPLLAQRLVEWSISHDKAASIEVIEDFQLNIEHVLDLQGRRRILIIDATCRPQDEVLLRPIQPIADRTHTTHAVSPVDLLATYERLLGEAPPPTQLLTIPGKSFELGETLSETTTAHLETAWAKLLNWCNTPPQHEASIAA